MKEILQSSFGEYDLNSETEVVINFMLNAKNELILISTSDETLDYAIKYILNYKLMKSTDLAKSVVYILPLSIQKG